MADPAEQMAAEEAAKQERIRRGMALLERIFEGGLTGTGRLDSASQFDASKPYYNEMGELVNMLSPTDWRARNPMGPAAQAALLGSQQAGSPAGENLHSGAYSGGGGHYGSVPAGQDSTSVWIPDPAFVPPPGLDRMAEEEQLAALMSQGLYSGTEETEGFNPSFYDSIYNAQLDYMTPQVERQFGDAQREIIFALARQGLGASSQGAGLQARLQSDREVALQDVQDTATQTKSGVQQAVEDERATLTSLLQQTGDLESTANMASSRADFLRQMPPLETIGPLFQNATGSLADLVAYGGNSPVYSNNPAGGRSYRQGASSGRVVG